MSDLTRAALALLLVIAAISVPLLFYIYADHLLRFVERRFPNWVGPEGGNLKE